MEIFEEPIFKKKKTFVSISLVQSPAGRTYCYTHTQYANEPKKKKKKLKTFSSRDVLISPGATESGPGCGFWLCWHFTAEWCEGWWVTPGVKCCNAAERRNCILMHPRLCQVDGSELYLCKDLIESVRREGRRGEGERRKSNYFSPNIPMLAVMCQTNKSREIGACGPATQRRLGSRVLDLFGLALCQRRSYHLSILDLSPEGDVGSYFCRQASSISHNMRLVRITVCVYEEAAHEETDASFLKYLIKTSHGTLRRGAEQLLFLKHPITLVPPAISWRWGLTALKGLI